MEVEGKVIVFAGENSGVSKSTGNPWKVKQYVLETKESFPRKIAFEFFGDRADQFPLNVGDEIRLSFDIESHEYQGRWYTRIRAWKSEPLTVTANPAAPTQSYGNVPLPPPVMGTAPVIEPSDSSEDLPF